MNHPTEQNFDETLQHLAQAINAKNDLILEVLKRNAELQGAISEFRESANDDVSQLFKLAAQTHINKNERIIHLIRQNLVLKSALADITSCLDRKDVDAAVNVLRTMNGLPELQEDFTGTS